MFSWGCPCHLQRERRLHHSTCEVLVTPSVGRCVLGGTVSCWPGVRGTAEAAPAISCPGPEGQTLEKLRLGGGNLPRDTACQGLHILFGELTSALLFPGPPALAMRECPLWPWEGAVGQTRAKCPQCPPDAGIGRSPPRGLMARRAQHCFLAALAWGPPCPSPFALLPFSLWLDLYRQVRGTSHPQWIPGS